MSVGIERRHSVDSDASWGNNGGGSGAGVGPSSPFTPLAAQHGGNGGGTTAEMTPEAGVSGRSLMARAGSAGRVSSADRASRGSAARDWSLSPSSAGRGSPLKSPAVRSNRPGPALTGRRMLYLVTGGFITLATISMLLAPSRSSSALSMAPAAGSKHVSAGSMVPQGGSAEADLWRPPHRVAQEQDSQQADSSAAVSDQLPAGPGTSGQASARKQWRPPGPNDTALSTMQGHPGQPGQRGRPGFYTFTDVRLQDRTVWVFSDPETVRNTEPFTVALSRLGEGFEVTVRHAVWAPPHGSTTLKCARRFRFPVALFYSPPDGSTAHHLMNGPLALFPTLDSLGLLDNHERLSRNNTDVSQYLSIRACKFRREVEGNQVVGLTWGPGDPYHPSLRWVSLLSHMLERQKIIGRDFAEDAVLCFDKLVLGRSHSLDWTVAAEDMATRRQTLKRFIWFAAHSSAVDHVNQAHYAELAAIIALNPAINMTHPNCRKKRTPRFLSGKAVVVVASRAASVGRAVLNEQELVDYIAATYDVHLEVVTEDSNSTWQMVDLMRNTDLFIGMHGDGWADAMFLRSEAVAFHMVPYGWLRAPGTARPLIRGNFYKTMVETTGAAFLVWANTRPENAIFREEDFADTPDQAFVPHPTPDMALPTGKAQAPYWIWQNTVLDMASLVPALDDAFAAAGILLRPDVAEARQAAQQPAEAGISAVSRRLQHVLSKLLPG